MGDFLPTGKLGTKSDSHWPLSIMLGAVSFLNLALPLFLVRILNPTDLGVYKVFFLYLVTAPVLLLAAGFNNGLYYWSHQGLDKDAKGTAAFQTTWCLQTLWSLAVVLVGSLLFLFTPLRSVLALLNEHTILLLVLAVGAMMSVNFFEEALIASGQIRRGARYSAAWECARTVGVFFSAAYFRTVDSVIESFLLFIVAKMIVSMILAFREKSAGFSALRGGLHGALRGDVTKAVLRYAIPSSVAAALFILINYADQFILIRFLSAAQFAAYSLGCLTVPPLMIFEQSVNKVLIPNLAKVLHNGELGRSANSNVDANSAKTLVRNAILELGLWLVPCVAGLYFFAGPISRLLFTNRYPETELYLKIYCFLYLTLIIPYDAWARASGRSSWVLKAATGFAFLTLVTTYLGAYFGGVLGALVSFIVSRALLRLYSLFEMKRYMNWRLKEIIPFQFLFGFSVVSLLTGFVTQQGLALFHREFVGLVVMGLLFWVIYIPLCVPSSRRAMRGTTSTGKVLQLTQFLALGGLEKMVLNLSTSLSTEGRWEPAVLVFDELPGQLTLNDQFGKIPIYEFKKGPGVSLKLALYIAKICRQEKIEILHAHDFGALIYASMAKIISFGVLKIVFTQHSFVHLSRARRYRLYEKIFTRLADQVCVVAPQLRQKYGELGLDQSKITIVENGVNFTEPTGDTQIGAAACLRLSLLPGIDVVGDEIFILNLARIYRGKGQDTVLKIWAQLPSHIRKRCRLIFVGASSDETFAAQVQEVFALSPDPGRISFVGGSLAPERWLAASDILISGSSEEGLPLAPIEALGAGLAVFLSDIPGHEMLAPYGELFPLGDLAQAARQLTQLITRVTVRGTTVEDQARSLQVRERFSSANMAHAYRQIYDCVSNERRESENAIQKQNCLP
jgi:glycosyltransferase involved in cell wall biosynthesis/O-antigen/teichoic acid export membrane protein